MNKLRILLLFIPSLALATDISQLPLSGSAVKPNIIIGYDDSGSMDWDYIPDSMGSSSLTDDYHYNPIAYNPNKEYQPWVADIASDHTVTRSENATVVAISSVSYQPGDTLLSGYQYTVSYDCNNYRKTIDFSTGLFFTRQSTCTNVNGSSYTLSSNYTVDQGQTWSGPAAYGYYYDVIPKASCTKCGTAALCPLGAICTDLPLSLTSSSHVRRRIFYMDPKSVDAINYANWKKYYSTRQLLMASAISDVLPALTGINMGIVPFNTTPNASTAAQGKMFNLDYSKDTLALLNYIYQINPNGGTPTHATLAKIGAIFNNVNLQLKLNTDTGAATTGKGIIQYSCQKNATLITTDGYANATSPRPISYSTATYGQNSPYAKIYPYSLADHALAYYTINLRPDLPKENVPIDAARCDPILKDYLADCNDNLHMNTYALTLGVPGSQYKPNANGQSPFPTSWNTPISSTNPIDGAVQIDDLWHATINGRGQMFSSMDLISLVNSIKAAFTDIVLRSTTQSAIGVANVNITMDNNLVYTSSFDAGTWTGDLKAYKVNTETGQILTPAAWSASQLLDTNTSRKFFSKNGPITSISGVDSDISDYLLGKPNDNFRYRTHIMGDAVNASPVVRNGMVYQAANDGMLHAFNAATGVEAWAYIPSQNIPSISMLTDPYYTHRYFVDSTPVVGTYNSDGATLLVGGLGAGQFGYYAIDVTKPDSPKPMWEFPGGQNIGGQGGTTSISQPRVIPTASPAYPYVVVISSGYNNGTAANNSKGDGYGYVWLLNPSDGKIIATLKTTEKAVDGIGLASFGAFISSSIANNKVSYLYGGDNLGNLWKIDARSPDIANWTIRKFAFIGQPITTKPAIAATSYGNPIVLFGTGRLLGASDKNTTDKGALYAIQDFQLDASPITNSSLVKIAATGASFENRILPSVPCVPWETKGNYGWYVEFPQAGERVINNPEIGMGYVTVTSNVIMGNSCLSASYAWILNLNLSVGNLCSAPGSGGSDPSIPGLNQGVYLSDLLGSNATLLSLTNGKVLRYLQLGDGSFNTQDLGSLSLLHSAVRSIRELKNPKRTD